MDCPHCHSSSTTEREGRTVHGFRRFRCRDCGRRYNERTGTALNRVQVPTDIVFLVVFWRLRRNVSMIMRQALVQFKLGSSGSL
jgi:putative transposase